MARPPWRALFFACIVFWFGGPALAGPFTSFVLSIMFVLSFRGRAILPAFRGWPARLGGPCRLLVWRALFRSLDHVCFVLSRAGHPSSLSRLAGPPWRALVILQSERILCGVRASRRSSCVNLVSGGRPPSLPHGLCLSSSAGPPWRTFLKLCFLDVYLFILFRFGGPALAGFLL